MNIRPIREIKGRNSLTYPTKTDCFMPVTDKCKSVCNICILGGAFILLLVLERN